MSAAGSRVVVYSRSGCHLCATAIEVVARVCAERDVAWTEVDVDAAPALREQYGDLVPVVLVDGVQQAFWTVDAGRVARALDRAR